VILEKQLFSSTFVDTREFLVTDDKFGQAKVEYATSESNCQNFFNEQQQQNSQLQVFVCTGFIARSYQGATTTLGRGGSDYTAGLLGNFLESEGVEIWTDVDGILSSDPRLVSEAQVLSQLSYSEAFEVANYGGKVLYAKTIEACQPKKVPLEIKNTLNSRAAGTTITSESKPGIKVISRSAPAILVEVILGANTTQYGLLAEIFQTFAEEQITVDVVSTSGDSVSFSVDKMPSFDLVERIRSQIGPIRLIEDQEIVALIGTQILDNPKFSQALTEIQQVYPKMVSMNTKNSNLTAVVNNGQGKELVAQLHKIMVEEE
jgi:aspartate kinase